MHPRPILRVALPLLGTALAITIPVAACSTTRPAGPPSTPALPAPPSDGGDGLHPLGRAR